MWKIAVQNGEFIVFRGDGGKSSEVFSRHFSRDEAKIVSWVLNRTRYHLQPVIEKQKFVVEESHTIEAHTDEEPWITTKR